MIRKSATKEKIASSNKLANGLGLTAEIQDRARGPRDRPTSPTMRRQQDRPQSPPALSRRPVSPPGLIYKQNDASITEKGRGKDSPPKRAVSPPASPRRPLSPKVLCSRSKAIILTAWIAERCMVWAEGRSNVLRTNYFQGDAAECTRCSKNKGLPIATFIRDKNCAPTYSMGLHLT